VQNNITTLDASVTSWIAVGIIFVFMALYFFSLRNHKKRKEMESAKGIKPPEKDSTICWAIEYPAFSCIFVGPANGLGIRNTFNAKCILDMNRGMWIKSRRHPYGAMATEKEMEIAKTFKVMNQEQFEKLVSESDVRQQRQAREDADFCPFGFGDGFGQHNRRLIVEEDVGYPHNDFGRRKDDVKLSSIRPTVRDYGSN
jgi:hypothetical protein